MQGKWSSSETDTLVSNCHTSARMGNLQIAGRYITHSELPLAIIGFRFEDSLEGLHNDKELFPRMPRDDRSTADLLDRG